MDVNNKILSKPYFVAGLTMLGLIGCRNVNQSEPYRESYTEPNKKIDTCLVSGVFESQKAYAYSDASHTYIRMINSDGVVYELTIGDCSIHYNQRGDTVVYDIANKKIVKNLTMERMEKNFIKSR